MASALATTTTVSVQRVLKLGASGGLLIPKLGQWSAVEDDCQRVFNDTNDALVQVVAYVPLICFPILLLLCTMGNVMNLWILSRYCRTGAKQVFLLSLAVSDMLAMWSSLPVYLNHNRQILGIHLSKNDFLAMSFGFFTWLQYTFCYVSDWILIAFSLERLSSFRFLQPQPLQRGIRGPALTRVMGIVVLAAVVTSGTMVWYYHWWNRSVDNYTQPEWVAQWVRLRQQTDIVCPILETLTLLVINLWLLRYLKRQLKLGKSLVACNRSAEQLNIKRISRHDNLTRMLLGCVCLYIITQLPMVTLNTLDHLSNAPYCLFQLSEKPYWEPIISTLALVNYSANFLVYVGTSAKYREVVHRLGCRVAERHMRQSTCSASGTVSGVIRNQLPFSWKISLNRAPSL